MDCTDKGNGKHEGKKHSKGTGKTKTKTKTKSKSHGKSYRQTNKGNINTELLGVGFAYHIKLEKAREYFTQYDSRKSSYNSLPGAVQSSSTTSTHRKVVDHRTSASNILMKLPHISAAKKDISKI